MLASIYEPGIRKDESSFFIRGRKNGAGLDGLVASIIYSSLTYSIYESPHSSVCG